MKEKRTAVPNCFNELTLLCTRRNAFGAALQKFLVSMTLLSLPSSVCRPEGKGIIGFASKVI